MIALLKPTKAPTAPDPKLFNCYRMLTLRNLIDKVFQVIITRRLSHFADLYGLLPIDQAGFRNHLSTIHALFTTMHASRRLASPERPIFDVHFDFMKAYDNV